MRFLKIALSVFVFVCFLMDGFAERIDIIKIKSDKFKEQLGLTKEQAEKIYNIFREEEEFRKSKVYGYDATQTVEENIQMEKDENEYILNKVKEILTEEQYQQYFLIRSKSIRNEITLYLGKELNLDYKRLVELDEIIQILYHELKLLKPEDKINQMPDENEMQKNMQAVESILFVLEKEIIAKLNDEQLKDYIEKKDKINSYIKKEIIKFKDPSEDRGDDSRKKQGAGGPPGGGMMDSH